MINLTKTIVIGRLVKAFELLKGSLLLLAAAVAIDFVGFFMLGFSTEYITEAIRNSAVVVANVIAEGVRLGVQQGIMNALSNPATRGYLLKLLFLNVILALIVFILYSLFQGTNWWIASKVAGVKQLWRKRVFGLARANTFWFLLLTLYFIINIYIDVRSIVVEKLTSQPHFNFAGTFAGIVAVALAYFALITQATGSRKTAWQKGFKHPFVFIPAFVIAAVLVLAADFIVKNAGLLIGTAGTIIAGIIIFLPVAALIRTYLVLVSEAVK